MKQREWRGRGGAAAHGARQCAVAADAGPAECTRHRAAGLPGAALPALAHHQPARHAQPHRTAPHRAGLACEAEEAGALQAELARVRAEQEALPPLVAELQEALEAETTDFMRKESGGCAKCALCAVQHHPLQSVR